MSERAYPLDGAAIERLAAARRDEFEINRFMLEAMDELDDDIFDAFTERLAAPIIAAIDCTQCARCCRMLDVYLEPEDGPRLAQALAIPLAVLTEQYIDRDGGAAYDAWGCFTRKPCALLRGNLCSVYEGRPTACRLYPQFTPSFRWTMADAIDGAAICPIIYHVLSELSAQIDAGALRPGSRAMSRR